MAAWACAAFGGLTLGIVEIEQNALTMLQKCAALIGQSDSARRPLQKLYTESRLERIKPPPNHRRRNPFGARSRRQAALDCDINEGGNLLELIHETLYLRLKRNNKAVLSSAYD
jgi:hypothetical protein